MFNSTDIKYQNRALEGVSRTFALTIPQLPSGLREVVGNAYLLCRIADTIEDETALTQVQKREFSEQFINVVAGKESAEKFAEKLHAQLSASTNSDERNLIRTTERVINITHTCTPTQQQALERCVRIMSRGMADFQERASLAGLADISELDQYCYYVAGVVGEMLTELFCDHCPDTAENYDQLIILAVSFGQALQMTNILKDVWDDQRRGVCWFPRDVFNEFGYELKNLSEDHRAKGYIAGLHEMVKITHSHQVNALRYIQLVPVHQPGIRRHCTWALGMAVLTLKRIYENPTFSSGSEVKISRFTVRSIISDAEAALKSNQALSALFSRLSSGFPFYVENQEALIN